jgi:hypothetical protein
MFWPGQFRDVLEQMRIFPPEVLPVLAWVVPAFELLLALALSLDRLTLPALFAAGFLCTVFAALHGYLLLVGRAVSCGCAGVAISFASRETHIVLLTISLLMMADAYYLAFREPAAGSLSPRSPRQSDAAPRSRRAGGQRL